MTLDHAPSRRSAETVRTVQACPVAPVRLRFSVGPRTLWSATRQLVRIAIPLERRALIPDLPALPDDADGFLVTGLRADQQDAFSAANQDLRVFMRAHYPRSYACLQGSFDDYLAHFSAKTRSTLRRKQRKLAERSGGRLDLRSYTRPDQVDDLYRDARAVSATTYQERLLGAGLPEGDASLATMRHLAARGALRSWILFLGGKPISYLYAPVDDDTVIYAYLGYDPDFADLSPGTVLQVEALRELIAEGRFRMFDFTEGDGQHKRQFATGAVQCVDLLLLRPTVRNRILGYGLALFDSAVATLKRLLPGSFRKLARAARR